MRHKSFPTRHLPFASPLANWVRFAHSAPVCSDAVRRYLPAFSRIHCPWPAPRTNWVRFERPFHVKLETLPKGSHRIPIPCVGVVQLTVDDRLWQPPLLAGDRLCMIDASRSQYVPHVSTFQQEFRLIRMRLDREWTLSLMPTGLIGAGCHGNMMVQATVSRICER